MFEVFRKVFANKVTVYVVDSRRLRQAYQSRREWYGQA